MPVAKRPRGRPQFKPTAAQRRTVEQMVSCGDSKRMIARALKIDEDTLGKHFLEELENGAARKRREVLDMLYKGAKKGNATLIKRLEEMTRISGAKENFDQPEKPRGKAAAPAQPRAPKLGKKEIQREAAMAAGQNSEWGDDLAPLPGTKPN
ncbi:MAG: hypothetical protein IKE42_15110 [Aquamicrobium sp.]|nr:hypothetical protein [Aquamicrobium sp.]